MTTEQIKQQYADLLILQYRGKQTVTAWSALTTYGAGDVASSGDIVYVSLVNGNLNHAVTDAAFWTVVNRARAHVELLAGVAIMDQLPVTLQDAFNLESALGVQLDILGKYLGVTRYGYDFSGAVTLTDDDFRQLIKIAIIQNASKSALSDIQNLLQQFFPGTIYVFDYGDMRMSYFLDSDAISEQLAQFYVKQGSLPKPMGVALGAILFLTTVDNFFGFRSIAVPGYSWSAITTYDKGDIVDDGTTNNLYVSLIDSNLNNAVSDAAAWQLLAFPTGGFSTIVSGLQGEILTMGDFI